MNDEEELETGLDVLRDTVGDMAEEDDESGGGPLTAAVQDALTGAAPTKVERPVREMLMRELEEARNRLVAKPAAPSSPLDRLIERFGGPTGKSGNLMVARRERAAEQAKKDEERRADLLTLLSRQEQFESSDINEQRRIEAARAKAAQKPKLATSAQEIIDLQTVISDQSLSQEQRDAASRKLKKIGADSSQEDRSVLGQISRATQMILSNDPEKVRVGQSVLSYFNREKGFNLTLSQLRTDEQIKRAEEFLKGIPEQELNIALSTSFPNARQKLIVDAYKMAREPTFESVLPQSGFSAEPIED
jgi:hypothetical protein